jgi:hypothetical protein
MLYYIPTRIAARHLVYSAHPPYFYLNVPPSFTSLVTPCLSHYRYGVELSKEASQRDAAEGLEIDLRRENASLR